MKYLFTLLATCFVLGLSAQTAKSGVAQLTTDKIESVKKDLLTQSDALVLSEIQIEELQNALKINSEEITSLQNSGIDPKEAKEQLSALESERNDIVLKVLSDDQKIAFKTANKIK